MKYTKYTMYRVSTILTMYMDTGVMEVDVYRGNETGRLELWR
jgi:hypothetical protein